jgi:putative hemolysin
MVDIGAKEGVIQEQEQELIENVLEFSDTTVEEVMTVKKNIEALKIESSVEEAVRFFLTHAHTRFPIYKGTINNIVGVLTVHEILMFLYDPQKKSKLSDFKLSAPIVVPKTKPINTLFHEFQRKRQHMAIVVDEDGDTVGLVTLEDILEEIVGDIADVHDSQERSVWSLGNDVFEAKGDTTIKELNKALDIKLDFPEHGTLSLLILEKLRRFPKNDEKIVYENLIFQIKLMSPKKIETVTITKLPAPAQTEERN